MLRLSRTLAFLVFTYPIIIVYSQNINGRLTDAKNNPVPFAAVYDETTYAGTTSNSDGYYELKLEPGKHSLVFKALGYYLERRLITTYNQPVVINIMLSEQAFELQEVVVRPGKEDPAYAIMRKVIGLAPYHLNQVKEYTSDVYLRGTIYIIKIPKILTNHTEVNGKPITIKNGDVFIVESMNQIHFKAPDKYEQKVISFHSTFPEENNEVDPMEIIRSSFYQPKVEDIISPLAPDAFDYYQFRYEGFFSEGGNTIFKIKATPKHNSPQLLNGYIYIVDQLWCLHSVDVSQEMIYGSADFKAIFSPIKGDAWLPISYQFNFDAAIIGMKANFKYSSSMKFQQVVLNEKVTVDQSKIEKQKPVKVKQAPSKEEIKKQKNQQEIDTLLSKERLSNRDMVKLSALMSKEVFGDTAKSKSLEIKDQTNKVTIEKDALKKDTAYWRTIRPIPLTTVEAQISSEKDSAKSAIKDTSEIKKSRKTNKITKFLLNGASFRAFDSTLHVKYNGLINYDKVDFNTVDGFIYRQTFSLEQRIDSSHSLKIDPGTAYAFSRKRFMWWTDINYVYSPLHGGNIHFHISSESADYNSENGINTTLNSIASLFFRRNYQKLYQQNLAFISNKLDIANGLTLSAALGYRTAQILMNNSDYSFFYNKTRKYSVNIPDSTEENAARNTSNEEAYWDARIEYTPQYYYKIRNGKKEYQYSKYPTFFIDNKMAVPGIVYSSADYDLIEAGAQQHRSWGLMHSFSWEIKGGYFLNRDSICLMDDKYFNNQDIPVLFGNPTDVFRLQPYYRNSPTQAYVEAHFLYTTPYLLIKYLPFLSNTFWCENLHFNYLTTNSQKNYWEIGYSISQIYFVGSIGVFAGFKGTNYQLFGIQAGFEFK